MKEINLKFLFERNLKIIINFSIFRFTTVRRRSTRKFAERIMVSNRCTVQPL